MLDCIGDRVKIYIFLIDNLNTLLNMMIMMMIVHCATARWCSHLFLFLFHRQSFLANERDALEGVCEERIMVSEEKYRILKQHTQLSCALAAAAILNTREGHEVSNEKKKNVSNNKLTFQCSSQLNTTAEQSSETKTNLNRCC